MNAMQAKKRCGQDVENKYQKIPDFVKMLRKKESIKKKAGMAKHLEMEVGKVAGEMEIWMKEVKEDKRGLEWVQSRLCEPWQNSGCR